MDKTTPTTPEDTIDAVLETFAKRIESMPRGKTYGWEAEKSALLALLSEAREAELKMVPRLLSWANVTDSSELDQFFRGLDHRIATLRAATPKENT